MFIVRTRNTKGGSITVPLTSCLTGLELAVWQLTIIVFIWKTDVMFDDNMFRVQAGNTKGGRITVPLTSCLAGLELAV